MITTDLYTTITLLLAVALAVMGVELMIKHIPEGEEFSKLKTLKGLVASVYLIAATFAAIEFLFWEKYHFETAAFLNMSSAAYQFVLCTAAITTCFNPAFTSKRKIAIWLGITTLWVVPLGVLNRLGYTWVVYAVFTIYIVQMLISGTLFYRNYREGITLIDAADSKHKVNLRRLNIGTYYLISYSIVVAVISCLPPIAHNILSILTIIFYIWFASRFSSLADRIYRDYLPVLTEAGLTDAEHVITDDYLSHEAMCRDKVDAWVANKGYIKGDLSREETARDMGLSEGDLKWYFAVCLKEDLRSWRVNLRLELAKEILEANPDAPINELAKAVGFTSRNNIYTHFRKLYGMTPKEYGLFMQQKHRQ